MWSSWCLPARPAIAVTAVPTPVPPGRGRGRETGSLQEAEIAQRLGRHLTLDDDEYARVEEMIDAARWSPVVERALRERLSAAERSVFLLVAADELTPAQAAECLGIGAVAARMRLSRARKKLRLAVEHGGAQEL